MNQNIAPQLFTFGWKDEGKWFGLVFLRIVIKLKISSEIIPPLKSDVVHHTIIR